MRNISFLLFFGLLISISSCRTDFDTVPSSGRLEFSASTVYLDTIFSTIGSSTYQLKVYNRSKDNIKIPKVQLGKGLDSKYRIMVDGRSENGKSFDNVELLANDSLFVFIETTVNIADAEPDFTYNDKILFDVGTNQQSVDLVTLIRDAIFIKPDRNLDATLYETIDVVGFTDENDNPYRGHTLTDTELNWTSSKPYVIYGNAVVESGKTLNIGPGTQVYFHYGASLIVDDGATIIIDGHKNDYNTDGTIALRKEVSFEGDRLEPAYKDVPGQWGTLFILSNGANSIKYLNQKNAVIGMYLVNNTTTISPNLDIENSTFYDNSNFGIFAKNSTVNAQNLVINTAGQATLVCSEKGPYNFTHCTINNNWNSSKQSAVLINDYTQTGETTFDTTSVSATFKNCIIYGSNNVEVFLDKKGSTFNTNFEACLFKFNDSNTILAGNTLYNNIRDASNFRNLNPKFKNIANNQLEITDGSAAIGNANSIYSTFSDINTNPRPTITAGISYYDIGAYQFIAD